MDMKYRLLLSSICTALLFSSSSHCASLDKKANPLFSVGFYADDSSDNPLNPLVLSSNDNGKSWEFNRNIPIVYSLPHFLNSVSCTQEVCVAGGDYGGHNAATPLLLRTTDGGQNWSHSSDIKYLPQMDNAFVNSVNCSSNTCVATGYFFQNFRENPLLLISQDQGQSWRAINYFRNMPLVKSASISHAGCQGNHCVGLMQSADTNEVDSHTMPIVSQDQGETWNYIDTIYNLPQHNTIELNTLKCKNRTCIAGGFLIKLDHKHNFRKPILIISQDAGTHWFYVKEITNLPTDMKFGSIKAIANAGTTWVAVGKFGTTKNTEVTSPLALVSNDNGGHWTFVTEISNLPHKSTRVNSVSCYGDLCVAAGYYLLDIVNEADGFELPLLLVSNDRGKSYTCINEISNLPAVKGAEISSIHCKGKTCVAIGHYDDINNNGTHNDAVYFPLVITSQDKGKNWSFVSVRDLPAMRYGKLESLSATSGHSSTPRFSHLVR